MKNFRLSPIVVAALAAFCISSIIAVSSEAQPLKKARRAGHPERDRITAAPSKTAPPASRRVIPENYPRYRLIDLGTLGGDNAFIVGAAITLNNRGENIAQGSTGQPDPFPDAGFTDDGTIWHGMLSTANGAVRDLGGLGGNQSLPTAIADNGLITGLGENGALDALTGFPQFRALFWDQRRTLLGLGTLGGNWSQGQAVNNRAQIVGQAANATAENPDVASFFATGLPSAQQSRAFIWERNAMRDLGTLGGNDAAAMAINENGVIAGFSATDANLQDGTGLPTIHPFLWKNEHMSDLGSLGGTLATTGSFANGPFGHVLNAQGQVAGTSMMPGDVIFHAFVWDKTQMIDLGTLGVRNSEAFFISDKGEVLGRIEVSITPYVRHGFLWEKGRMTDLGTASPCNRATPLSMNSAGQIVGDSGACTADPNDPGYFSAFYQEKGKAAVDIHSLITPPTPLHLDDAVYINDRGEISAGGFDAEGRTHAVLLVPIRGR
jgi:probable HAF family extracellular repeat protein